MNRRVRAFSPIQRFYHRHLIYLMFFFILSGLPVLSDSFHWVAYVFSYPFNFLAADNPDLLATGLQVCRALHRVCALIFVLITLPFGLVMLTSVRRWQVWPERWGLRALAQGLRELKANYVDYGHARFGKYNIGQKAAFWAFFVGLAALTASGFVLWFRGELGQGFVEAMRMTHDLAFAVIAITLVMHIYFALFPPNRYGLEAMFRNGLVDEDIVREHHGLWYQKIKDDPDAFEPRE